MGKPSPKLKRRERRCDERAHGSIEPAQARGRHSHSLLGRPSRCRLESCAWLGVGLECEAIDRRGIPCWLWFDFWSAGRRRRRRLRESSALLTVDRSDPPRHSHGRRLALFWAFDPSRPGSVGTKRTGKSIESTFVRWLASFVWFPINQTSPKLRHTPSRCRAAILLSRLVVKVEQLVDDARGGSDLHRLFL